jgi:tetratricopeptide (TPR) repeat protein
MRNVPDASRPFRRFSRAVLFVLLLGGAIGVAPAADTAASDLALERGDYAQAARLRSEAARRSNDTTEYAAAARFAYEWTQYSVVASTADDWIRNDPTSEGAHRFRGVAALELDRRDTAVREFEWLLEHAYPSLSDGFDALGRSLADLHNRAALAYVMGDLSRRHPEVVEGHLQAGAMALAAGNAERALSEAQRAVELGRSRQGRALASRAHVVAGRCEEGLSEATPLGHEDRLLTGWLLAACDRGAEAESIFQELSDHPATKVDALEALAGRELDSQRHDAAARHYSELGKAGEHEAAQFGLAALAERAGDRQKAIVLYAGITSGRRASAAQLRAYRLRLVRDGAEWADRWLDEFLAANPSLRQELTVGRLMALSEAGYADRALGLAVRAERAYPDVEEYGRAHAEALVRTGHTDEAVRLLERLLARRSEDPAVLNALGYTLAESGRDLRRADRLLAAALLQSPDNPAYLDSVGWLRFQQHDYNGAMTALTRAYRLQSDPEIGAHAVAALYAGGDTAAARQLLQSALERFPADPHLVAVGHRLPGGVP